jgi:hypothetical protein
MNRNLEEQKIKQWFREARQRDESRAPSFADTLAAARSNHQPAGWRLNIWRIAFALVALIAIGIVAFVLFKQSTTQPVNQIAVEPALEQPSDDLPKSLEPTAHPPGSVVMQGHAIKGTRANAKPLPRRPRAMQPQRDSGPAALLSFKWQSPTDFLLRTPGAALLKTVPRIGDSLIRFDVIHSDEKN